MITLKLVMLFCIMSMLIEYGQACGSETISLVTAGILKIDKWE